VSSHEELEMLHESIRSSLIDLTVVITEYFTNSAATTATISPSSSSLRQHPSITAIATTPSLLSRVTADIISTLHFSTTTPPIIFWEDGHYVPRRGGGARTGAEGGAGAGRKGAIEEIQEYIHSFLFLTRIPLTEVSKVWKISLHDLLRFVEAGYLEVYEGGDWEGDDKGDQQWEEGDPTEDLILEKSTGLSVYSSSTSAAAVSKTKKMQERSESRGDGEMKLGPFSSSLLTSSGTRDSRGRGLAPSPPPPFLTQCISRIDLYSQPSILQVTYLTNLQDLCGPFGFNDLSEVVVFLSHRTGPGPGPGGGVGGGPSTSLGRTQGSGGQGEDHLPVIEWGVEMFMITTELTEILLRWKLISFETLLHLLHDHLPPSAPPSASPSAPPLSDSGFLSRPAQKRLEIHEIKERILTSRRLRRRGEGGSAGSGGGEYYPIIDWLGVSYVLQEDLQEILRLFRDDHRKRGR
jgi:hypothetical protein